MKKFSDLKRISCLAIFLTLTGCATTPPPPLPQLIKHAVWETNDKALVYDACLKGLHLNGFMILVAERESGLLATEWKDISTASIDAKFRMNLLIFSEAPGHTSLSIRYDINWSGKEGHKVKTVEAEQIVSKSVTDTMDSLFLEFDRLVGKASDKGYASFTWK
ncbi:hypothetical protein P0Y35_11140 [Kiritimatiellaeota bacterium B1221]|nr:hypothetical protein [Kiritimatiellaeota bacterium B1221]